MNDLRIVFFGNPPLAEAVLNALEVARLMPALIITEPDKEARRGKGLIPAPVKVWGEEYGIDVLQPHSLKEDEVQSILTNSEWDLFIVASYGKILPKRILDLPKHGILNMHPSLLPKYRGASPFRSQILADDSHCGVSIMLLDEEMDHGPLLAQASIDPEPWPLPAETLGALLAHEGGTLLAEVIPEWVAGRITPTPQEHDKATYTKKIKKEDGHLDLSDDGHKNYIKFCAYDGWPGTYFIAERDGKDIRIKITDAEFADGEFRVKKVIPEGKKEMSYSNFMRQ